MAKDYLGAANNKVLPRFRHAIDEEASELSDFSRALRSRIQAWPINDLNTILQAAVSGGGGSGTRSLRTPIAATLVGCGEFCRQSKLSLPDRRTAYDDRNWAADDFGYERELQPTELERRCGSFFGPAPQGWNADHAVLSSGQAAMAGVLHLLETLEPLGLRAHYAQRILALTSRRPRSLLCFLRCCM